MGLYAEGWQAYISTGILWSIFVDSKLVTLLFVNEGKEKYANGWFWIVKVY